MGYRSELSLDMKLENIELTSFFGFVWYLEIEISLRMLMFLTTANWEDEQETTSQQLVSELLKNTNRLPQLWEVF